jgi:hypothetical protein
MDTNTSRNEMQPARAAEDEEAEVSCETCSDTGTVTVYLSREFGPDAARCPSCNRMPEPEYNAEDCDE